MIIASVFLVSLFVGSFLNVLIYRLPVMMFNEYNTNIFYYVQECLVGGKKLGIKVIDDGCSQCGHQIDEKNIGSDPKLKPIFNVAWPPSRCSHCQHKIRFYENIPVISYLFLKGKCSQCHHKIAIRYPIIELLTAVFSTLIALKFPDSISGYLYIFLFWGLFAAAWIDFDHQLLPDSLVLPLMWLGILAAKFNYLPISLDSSVIGAVVGYLSFWSIYWIFKLLTKKEGMGYGDFKLLACLGAWLGLSALPFIILLSSVSGAIVGITLILFKKQDSQKTIPFGPHLIFAGFIVLFWGDMLSQLFKQLV